MIHQTSDYSQFKSIVSNREVDERHVKRLMKAIEVKNLLHINPILCNKEFEVVDGQHRLEAATRLGLPIYYIIDAAVNKADIAAINSNAKNWDIVDYVNYWTIEKKPGFDKLSAFISQFPNIPISTALLMCSSAGARDYEALRQGYVNVDNYQQACEIAEILKFYRNIFDSTYERNFVLAVIASVKTPGYDHEAMKKKLEYQSRSLVRCVSKKQYLEMLEEIYNHSVGKHRIKFAL